MDQKVGSAGFEPAASSAQDNAFKETYTARLADFDKYLAKVLTSHKDITYLVSVAKKYQHILNTGNASEVQTMTPDTKRQTMRALSHLSKYNGCYERWQKMIKNHGIHWSQTTNNAFTFFEKETITEMITYVKHAIAILPKYCANTFVLATLLGLRADEVMKCIRLIKQDAKDYYNADTKMLEHYKFKDLFLRRTKKAYISLVDDDLLNLAKQSCDSWYAIKNKLRRKHKPMNMSYCRKIFGTWLRQNGIESEFIDVLQGRVPSSIFAKHYYRPDQATLDKARTLVGELKNKLH